MAIEHSKNIQRTDAAELLRQLAYGVDPETGSSLEADHILQRPNVIRALVLAVETLQKTRSEVESLQKTKKNVEVPPDRPARAGVPWSREEDLELRELFDSRLSLREIAVALERKAGGISSRLVRLGIVESREQARTILRTESGPVRLSGREKENNA